MTSQFVSFTLVSCHYTSHLGFAAVTFPHELGAAGGGLLSPVPWLLKEISTEAQNIVGLLGPATAYTAGFCSLDDVIPF